MEIGKRGVGYLELTYRNHNQIYFVVRLPSNFVILHLQPGLGGIYFFDFPNIIFKLLALCLGSFLKGGRVGLWGWMGRKHLNKGIMLSHAVIVVIMLNMMCSMMQLEKLLNTMKRLWYFFFFQFSFFKFQSWIFLNPLDL